MLIGINIMDVGSLKILLCNFFYFFKLIIYCGWLIYRLFVVCGLL